MYYFLQIINYLIKGLLVSLIMCVVLKTKVKKLKNLYN